MVLGLGSNMFTSTCLQWGLQWFLFFSTKNTKERRDCRHRFACGWRRGGGTGPTGNQPLETAAEFTRLSGKSLGGWTGASISTSFWCEEILPGHDPHGEIADDIFPGPHCVESGHGMAGIHRQTRSCSHPKRDSIHVWDVKRRVSVKTYRWFRIPRVDIPIDWSDIPIERALYILQTYLNTPPTH